MYEKLKHADLMIHLGSAGSTMNEVRNLINSVQPPPDNLLVIADTQTAGKGRDGNLWLSPKGGLWFTYCFKPVLLGQQVVLLLGLSLRETLAEQFPNLAEHLRIKWPNDILYGSCKLAGFLVQVYGGYLSIGAGINTNVEITLPEADWQPISLKQILGFDVSHKALVSRLLDKFSALYQRFVEAEQNVITEQINMHLFGKDRKLRFHDGFQETAGVCRGVAEDGALIVEKETGQTVRLYAGSIISSES